MLLQHADAQAFLEHNVATVGTVLAGYQPQQGRFSGTVARYEPNVLTFGHAERDIFEKDEVADAFRQILYVKIGSRHAILLIIQAKIQKNRESFRSLPRFVCKFAA